MSEHAVHGFDAGLVLDLFPFHFIVDETSSLRSIGRSLARIAPGMRIGEPLATHATVLRPRGVTAFAEVVERRTETFLIELVGRERAVLRGQMVPSSDRRHLIFVGSPWLAEASDLGRLGLTLADFPPHDPSGDMLVLLQTRDTGLADLRRLTDRLRETAARLDERNRQLEEELRTRAALEEQLRQGQKMEALGRLAGGVAHDFNNILTAIRGFADLALRRTPPDSSERRLVESIGLASERGEKLIEQLFALGRQSFRAPVRVDPVAEVREVLTLLRPSLPPALALHVSVEGDVGRIWADATTVHQIVSNLVLNARDALPEGGNVQVALRARGGPDASGEPRAVVLEVRDDGVGMPEEVRARIFEPFFTTKGAVKGTGLGLASVYAIVQRAHGRIDVESEPGVGTLFRVTLPCVDDGECAPARASSVSPVGTTVSARRRLLLVEDDPGVRNLVEMILGQTGDDVVTAADAERAIALFDARGPFDALVTDVRMPGLTGPELAHELERGLGRDVPTVFMSGYAGSFDTTARGLAPHQRFVVKPFTSDALLAAIEEVVAAHRPRA